MAKVRFYNPHTPCLFLKEYEIEQTVIYSSFSYSNIN
jgi:hypothetical protein